MGGQSFPLVCDFGPKGGIRGANFANTFWTDIFGESNSFRSTFAPGTDKNQKNSIKKTRYPLPSTEARKDLA
jgi:hypothetical protein